MPNPIQIIIQGAADFSSINEEFKKMGESSSSAFGAITKGAQTLALLGKGFALFEAFKEAVNVYKDLSDEWVRSAKALGQLDAALKSTGQASETYRHQLEEQRKTISAATAVHEDQLAIIQRQFVQYKASREQVEELTALSLDLAASQGIDATSAAHLLARALGGEEVQMRGVRLEIDRTLPKYEQINSMIRQVNAQAGGQYAAALQASGRYSAQLANNWRDTKETVGEVVNLVKEGLAFGAVKAGSAVGGVFAPQRIRDQWRGMMDWAEGRGPLEETPEQKAKREAAAAEAQRLHVQRMNLFGLQTTAGIAAAGFPGTQADIEIDRAENEMRYALNKESLKKYLEARLDLITREANAERSVLDKLIASNAKETDQKKAELDATKTGTDLQQIEKAQQAYDALLIKGKALATQSSIVTTTQLTGLTNERLFGAQHPTTFGGGIQKGWTDEVKSLGTVYENLAKTITNTVGAAIDGVSKGITGLITGTETWGQALRNIGTSILGEVINALVRAFAAQITGVNLVSAAKIAATQAEAAAKLAADLVTMPLALIHMLAKAVSEGGWAAAALIAAAVAAVGVGVAAAEGAFAEGGRPPVGEVALVGERGPELFVPDTAGTIIPAHVTSEILNGKSSTRNASRNKASGKERTVQVHVWFDKTEMTKHIQNDRDAQHAVVQALDKHRHVVLRS